MVEEEGSHQKHQLGSSARAEQTHTREREDRPGEKRSWRTVAHEVYRDTVPVELRRTLYESELAAGEGSGAK
jgi:hypothetical protein